MEDNGREVELGGIIGRYVRVLFQVTRQGGRQDFFEAGQAAEKTAVVVAGGALQGNADCGLSAFPALPSIDSSPFASDADKTIVIIT
jgi:hypothetical protein